MFTIKKIFCLSLLILSLIMVSCSTQDDKPSETATVTESSETKEKVVGEVTEKQLPSATEPSANTVQVEHFTDEIREAVSWGISESDIILDIIIENRDVKIYLDISNTDPTPFTPETYAETRTSSITDEILDLKELDELWDTITIDFGTIGFIINDRANLEENEQGGRYFKSDNFKLQH